MNIMIKFLIKNKCYTILSLLPNISLQGYLQELFKKETGRDLNLKNPERFTEKIQVQKIKNRNNLIASLSDKIKVKDYVNSKIGCNSHSAKLYGAWKSFDELEKNCDFSALPQKFFIKTNHACTTNILIKDKKLFADNLNILNRIFTKFLKTNYAYKSLEMQYEKIKPQIFIEEYLESINEKYNKDYRFMCFNGKPVYIEFFSKNTCIIYDVDWKVQSFTHTAQAQGKEILPPLHFKEMLKTAEILSKGFDFVRIDFLETKEQFYVSEMTFTPCSGYMTFYPDEYDFILGNILELT